MTVQETYRRTSAVLKNRACEAYESVLTLQKEGSELHNSIEYLYEVSHAHGFSDAYAFPLCEIQDELEEVINATTAILEDTQPPEVIEIWEYRLKILKYLSYMHGVLHGLETQKT